MKLDEILNSQKASTPVVSTPTPVTKKTGTLRLSDILSQEPSTPNPKQDIPPILTQVSPTPAPKIRTVTNEDNTIKEGVNIAPTFTKTQKAKMGAKLAYNALTEGVWGLPEAMVRGIPSALEAFTRLTKSLAPTMPVIVGDEKAGKENSKKNIDNRLKASQEFTKIIKDNTTYLDEWKQLGEEYRKAEDAGVPEEFRNSITGKVSSGVGSSASFLSTLLATRGLGMGAQFAGAGTKIGETLAVLANTSQKLGIPLNTLAESQQIKEETRAELIDMGKSEEEAEKLSSNVFAVSAVATPVLDAIGLFNPAIKKTLVKKLAQFGIDIGSEVAQELTQSGAQNVATDKNVFEGAKETTTIAGITSAIFSLLTKGHLSLKRDQAQPTATEPIVNEDGTTTVPPETPPTVGDIIANGQENYTQEEKVTAINNADFENNLVDPENEVEKDTPEYNDLKKDIQSAIDEGASIGDVVLRVAQEFTVSQEYAEDVVADVLASKQQDTDNVGVPKDKGIASPEIKTLDEEAKKYKTIDEFIASQGKPLYHGSKNIKNINKNGFSLSNAKAGVKFGDEAGIYLSNDISRSKEYGDVGEFYLKPNLKIAEITNDEIMSDAFGNQQKIKDGNINKYFKEQGYDGVTIIGKKGQALGEGKTETIIFDPNNIKTKSQLTDIYNKTKKENKKNVENKQESDKKLASTEKKEDKAKEGIIKPEKNVKDDTYELYVDKEIQESDILDSAKTKETLDGLYAQKEAIENTGFLSLQKFESKRGEFKGQLNINNGTGKFFKEYDTRLREVFNDINNKFSSEELIEKYDSLKLQYQEVNTNIAELEKLLKSQLALEKFLEKGSDYTNSLIAKEEKARLVQEEKSFKEAVKKSKKLREAKKGIRSVAKNLEDKAKELGISIEDSYEMKRFVEEVAISEQYLENNKERIDSILDGSFPYPKDVSKTAFLHTIIENAKANNDTKMLTKAYNALAEEGTKAGQDIAFINSIYKTYDETSPETYLNKIRAERESMAFRKDWKLKNPFAIDEKKKEFIKKRTQRQKAIKTGVKDKATVKIRELENILESFMC